MIREAIIKAIKDQRISQRQVAIRSGTDYRNFNEFIRGKRPLPLEKLNAILRELKLEIAPQKGEFL